MIECLNMGEVLAGIEARKKKLDDLPKLARQMGVMATNEIHPLTHKKSGTWDGSIHAEVKEVGTFQWELWVGSRGAFSGTGYNYGKRQEDLYHPIAIGWLKAQPMMTDHWNAKMKGIATVNAAGMSDFSGLDVSEW